MPEFCPNCGCGLVADGTIVEIGTDCQNCKRFYTEDTGNGNCTLGWNIYLMDSPFEKPGPECPGPGRYKLVPVDKADAPNWRCPRCGVTMCEGENPAIAGSVLPDTQPEDIMQTLEPPPIDTDMCRGLMARMYLPKATWYKRLWLRLWWRVRNWWGNVWERWK